MPTVIENGVRRDMTQAEIDADNAPDRLANIAESDAKEALAAEDRAEVASEISLSPLDGVTFAQAEAYIATNVTDLASAKVVLKKLAKAILILNKRMGI